MINFAANRVIEFVLNHPPPRPLSEESDEFVQLIAERVVGALELIESLGLDAHDDDLVDEVMNEVRAILDEQETADESPALQSA